MIAELALVRTFLASRATKALYLASLKALCRGLHYRTELTMKERSSDWKEKFQSLGISVLELTETEPVTLQMLAQSDIIISTPEKWDATTRKWKDMKHIMQELSLIIIDEVHLLQESRGATLEGSFLVYGIDPFSCGQ